MKTRFLLLGFLLISIAAVHGQDEIPLTGQKAPSITANSTNGEITFPEDFGNNWKILFSHPRDFTPVCTSEVLQLARMQDEFNKLGVKIAVISTDGIAQHERWKQSIEEIKVDGIDPVKIYFPIIDDQKAVASRLYGMIHEKGNSIDVKDSRGVFIIDSENIIQAIFFYPIKVGRNFAEIKRTVEALQTVNNHAMTPANWEPGDDMLMRASPYLNPKLNHDEIPKEYYNIGPIMWYKRTSANELGINYEKLH